MINMLIQHYLAHIRAFGYTPLVAVATMKEYGRYRTTYSGVMAEAEEEEHEGWGFLQQLIYHIDTLNHTILITKSSC